MKDGTIVERCEKPVARFSLLDEMTVERGTKEDWEALHSLHYKAESVPPDPHYWRCVDADGYLVGLVVFGTVGLLLAPRHDVFPRLKPGRDTHFTNVHRAKFLNMNFRRAARIVTDTMYRGSGVSYRMLNLACRMEGFRFIEIQSSMSKFNPFDKKAGFRQNKLRSSNAYEDGIKVFRRYFESHPADYMAVLDEYHAMPEGVRLGALKAMQGFFYKHSVREKTGRNLGADSSRVDSLPFEPVLRECQQLVFATPVYGIWENPDLGRDDMPESLPISAFDRQAPHERLVL